MVSRKKKEEEEEVEDIILCQSKRVYGRAFRKLFDQIDQIDIEDDFDLSIESIL